ncbi:histone deacetylase complex subunit SAP30 homolog [Vanessa cardui]|uniref:histone deacetylase complex subunit SAP30 homolog n=1 Tax=Vanessa cardui TaxID=171605 RepID=UPI001F13E157|nr:histone deacetylase complex subunit SAP30 homolog [Vanessa cardui]
MIQREYPMNNGFSTGEEDSRGNSDQICCLVDDSDRCRRPAGNASYSKRIQKTVVQRRLKLNIDPQARHTYICDYHKTMIQCARTKQRRPKDSEDDSHEAEMDSPEVDWVQLQVNTLKRYKKHYKVPTKPGFNKNQLAEAIQKHFKSLPVNEKEIVTYFIYMVKTNGNKLDQKNGMNSDSV